VSKVTVLVDPGRNARKEQVSEMGPPKIQGKKVLHREIKKGQPLL
jgi:hypothetical protein